MRHQVSAHADHIAKVTAVRKPILAVAELVWNALDADAKRVDIDLEYNDLDALVAIDVSDDGWGMSPEQAHQSFSGLGGSWKRLAVRTEHENRVVHGKEGQGRFKALALGRFVKWSVNYRDKGKLQSFALEIDNNSADGFDLGDPAPAKRGAKRGVRVRITELHRSMPSLEGDNAEEELAQIFALYLRRYRNAAIYLRGVHVDPTSVEDRTATYPIGPLKLDDGAEYDTELEIVEWKVSAERRLYLCDAEGFPLDEMAPGVQAPGYNFTAYLKSEGFKKLDAVGGLTLGDLDTTAKTVIDAAKKALRDHFRNRAAEDARGLVDQWKQENVYPYVEEPASPAEEQERQVFNIAALNVHAYLPKFSEADIKTRQLQLKLLRHAIETGPEDALRFLTEVLDLPDDRRAELKELLDRTTLSNLISAGKIITDRLEFLHGLGELVFDADLKERLKERTQLHRILAPNTWLFGEQYHLAADDEGLTTVLRKHLDIIGDDRVVDDPVVRTDGSTGIVDLMLSRCLLTPGVAAREHLIIELKRPNVKIGNKEANQIESYAHAVANDERFRGVATKWVFWVVSSDLDANIARRTEQAGRPRGVLYQDEGQNITVWVRTWAQILEDGKARMRFFQERLGYTPDRDASLGHLKTTYEKHVGALFAAKDAKPA